MSKISFYSQSNGKHSLFLVSLVIMIIAWFFANFTTYSNYIVYPFLVLWMVAVLTAEKCLSHDDRVFVKVSFCFLAIELIYWIIGYSSTNLGVVLRDINWIMAGVISIYAMKLFSKQELYFTYIVLIIASILLLVIFIRMGRSLLLIDDQGEAALVTGAWYGSLFMLLSGLSLIVFIHVKASFPRILSAIVLFLTLYLNIVVLQRGINVIFTIAELGVILVFAQKRKELVYFFSLVIVIFTIYIYASGLLISLFDGLANSVSSERLAVRFREIALVLHYEDLEASSGSFAGRNELIGYSWSTFTSGFGHFVFGAGEHYTEHTIIGHHSFFIDTLAKYGIIGGFLVYVYFKKQYQIIMSFLNKKTEWAVYMQCSVVFVVYVLRNLYGNMAFAVVNLVVLLLFPLTFQVIRFYKQ